MTSLECNPYLDTTSFFRINDEPKESKDMLDNCDQSKILEINYLDRLQPMGLYGKVEKNNLVNNDYVRGKRENPTEQSIGANSLLKPLDKPGDPDLRNLSRTLEINYIQHSQPMNHYKIDKRTERTRNETSFLNSVPAFDVTEGFTTFVTDNGLGESTIPKNECPEGYTKCKKTGKCIQVCIGCKYRDSLKSQEFNEADPCFPNGVYNGVTHDGFIKCTCGRDNQYCSDSFFNENLFTTDGILLKDNHMKKNVGDTSGLRDLFLFDQL